MQAGRGADCRQSCNQGVSPKARRKIPRAPLVSVRTRDGFSATRMRDDLAAPAACPGGVGFVHLQHHLAALRRLVPQELRKTVVAQGEHMAHGLAPYVALGTPGHAPHPQCEQQEDVVVRREPVRCPVVQFVHPITDLLPHPGSRPVHMALAPMGARRRPGKPMVPMRTQTAGSDGRFAVEDLKCPHSGVQRHDTALGLGRGHGGGEGHTQRVSAIEQGKPAVTGRRRQGFGIVQVAPLGVIYAAFPDGGGRDEKRWHGILARAETHPVATVALPIPALGFLHRLARITHGDGLDRIGHIGAPIGQSVQDPRLDRLPVRLGARGLQARHRTVVHEAGYAAPAAQQGALIRIRVDPDLPGFHGDSAGARACGRRRCAGWRAGLR